MTYTKQNAKENKKISKMAKELLAKKGDGVLDTVASQHPDIHAEIQAEFPTVKKARIISKIAKALRILRGDEVRRRGGQAGNQNAAKAEKSSMWSGRLPLEIIQLIRDRAEAEGISQSDYVKDLIMKDNKEK